MKIFIKENEDIQETEVMIYCRSQDEQISRLKRHIEQFTMAIRVTKEQAQYNLPLKAIYYIEVVDGKTYVYTETEMYTSHQSLINLESKLKGSSFVRISKGMLLNVDYLQSVTPMENHRMMATLKNDEKVIVGRTYISKLKEKLQEELR